VQELNCAAFDSIAAVRLAIAAVSAANCAAKVTAGASCGVRYADIKVLMYVTIAAGLAAGAVNKANMGVIVASCAVAEA
jgi:hypothetical protein